MLCPVYVIEDYVQCPATKGTSVPNEKQAEYNTTCLVCSECTLRELSVCIGVNGRLWWWRRRRCRRTSAVLVVCAVEGNFNDFAETQVAVNAAAAVAALDVN